MICLRISTNEDREMSMGRVWTVESLASDRLLRVPPFSQPTERVVLLT
jgi:hypothetical protein